MNINAIGNKAMSNVETQNRLDLLKTAFNTVELLSQGRPPYMCQPDDGVWDERYLQYEDAISLLECLTAREFMAMFTGYTMSDGDTEFYSNETTELITDYGSDEPLGERVLDLLEDIEKQGNTSWGIWTEFYLRLTTVFEHKARVAGESNRFNDFRIKKGIPDFWKVQSA